MINAEGEQQAAQKLVEAAEILAPVPQAMQLRYLATLTEIAGEKSSTIVFPSRSTSSRDGSANSRRPRRQVAATQLSGNALSCQRRSSRWLSQVSSR